MKSQTRAYVMNARAAKMEETRRRILDAAAELYLQRGIDEFTLEEAARRAGTTVQTILRIHASRDRLLYAALDKLARAGVPLKPTPPGDIAAAVAAIFDLYEAIGDMVMQWLADERRRPALKPMMKERPARPSPLGRDRLRSATRGAARRRARDAAPGADPRHRRLCLANPETRQRTPPRGGRNGRARMIEAVANRETKDDKTAVVELVEAAATCRRAWG